MIKREEFSESMKKILAFSKSPETTAQIEALENYLTALYGSVIMWSAAEFDDVCQELMKTVKITTRPDPKAFYEIRRHLQDSRRSKLPEGSKCSTCNGQWYVTRYYIFTPTDQEVTAMKPCPKCNREKHDAHRVDERLVEIEGQ